MGGTRKRRRRKHKKDVRQKDDNNIILFNNNIILYKMSSTLNPAIHGSRTPHDPNDPKDPNNKEVGDWGHFVSDSPQESKPNPPRVVDTDILRGTTGIGRKLSFSSDEGDIETGEPGTKEKNHCELVGNCSIQGGKKRRRKSRKKRKRRNAEKQEEKEEREKENIEAVKEKQRGKIEINNKP